MIGLTGRRKHKATRGSKPAPIPTRTSGPVGITATVEGGRIRLRTPYEFKDRVKAIPGARWDAKRRLWHVPATPAGAKGVVEALYAHGLEMDDQTTQLAALAEMAAEVKATDDLPAVERTKTTPWRHQLVGYHMVARQPATMLAFDMGTGKSKVVVDAVVNLDDVQAVLIVCPAGVVDVWPAEFAKHAADEGIIILPLRDGSTAERARRMKNGIERARALGRKIACVVNYEAIWRGDLAAIALARQWDMVVADEIHRIKAPGGKVSRFLEKLGRRAARRVGLTGTPMPHSPLDVYGQYRFLDPGIFGTSFVRFRAQYAVMGGYGGHEVLGYHNQDDLTRRFYTIAHRVSKDDVLDLPPAVHERRRVELGGEGRRLYHELENEFIADVAGGVVTAANALARLLRLQQITSGFTVLEGDQDRTPVEVDDGKGMALAEILEDIDLGEPVVVFCRFRADLDRVRRVAESAERRYCELSGRGNELACWQGRADGEVLGVQIQAGGVGIDLTRAAYCVYYSLGFSLGDYEQSLARLHRAGQQRSVTYLHLIAAGTVDEQVHKALRTRANVIEQVLAEMGGEANKERTGT